MSVCLLVNHFISDQENFHHLIINYNIDTGIFLLISFSESEENIFNPNCKCIALLTNIKEKCKFGEECKLAI